MKGYCVNIERQTKENENFRQVLYTARHSQLVLMSVAVGAEIGMEVHEVDQFFRFENGNGVVIIDGNEYKVGDGDAVIVPAGANHNIINTSPNESLKLYALYMPPHHKDGTIHPTKEAALSEEEDFDGATTEPM